MADNNVHLDCLEIKLSPKMTKSLKSSWTFDRCGYNFNIWSAKKRKESTFSYVNRVATYDAQFTQMSKPISVGPTWTFCEICVGKSFALKWNSRSLIDSKWLDFSHWMCRTMEKCDHTLMLHKMLGLNSRKWEIQV